MNPRLDNVQERLEAALGRIDDALTARESDEGMAEQLSKMTAAYDALRGQNIEISRRLDAAIERLRTVLKE